MKTGRSLLALGLACTVAGAAPAGAQVIRGGLLVASPTSRVALGDALEETGGVWIGGGLEVEYGRLGLAATAARGELAPDAAGAVLARDVGEVALRGSFAALPWLWADAEYTTRAFRTVVGRQVWKVLGVGGSARHRLGNTGATAFFRVAYLPVVSVDGLDSPGFSVAADVGLRTPLPWLPLELAARYRIERFDFPEAAGTRADQFQYVQVQVGMTVARVGGRWVLGRS